MDELQQFERARFDVAGQGVTITSLYEPEKTRWRANAPAHGHLLNHSGGDAPITAATRQKAIQDICTRLEKRMKEIEASRQTRSSRDYR